MSFHLVRAFDLQVLIAADISLWEIYHKVIVPDLYQLEHGITVTRNGIRQRLIGSVHVIVGDNKEIQILAGLHGACQSRSNMTQNDI